MARAAWLVELRISCAIYLRATRDKMASRFASLKSEEIIQINFLGYLLSHCFSIYYNNYSPQCRWLAVDIIVYLALHGSVNIHR